LDVVEANGKGTLTTLPTTYAYATSPNFARAGVNIVANRETIFKHTGSGNAFTIDGGLTGGGFLSLRFENITVHGNSNSTHGFYVRAIHHSVFNYLTSWGASTTGAAFQVEGCYVNQWNSPKSSGNGNPYPSTPLYGFHITRRGAGSDSSTTQTIINPILEKFTTTNGSGIRIDYAGGNTIIGGTSELNYDGVQITANSYGLNLVQSIDLEDNAGNDLRIAGVSNTFIDIYGISASLIESTANRNVFMGGWLTNLVIEATAHSNTFNTVLFITSRTDNSTAGNFYHSCTDNTLAYFMNHNPGIVIATASLPAAGTAMNGTILIEDAGAGDRNLIIYAGGERFRIDGGTNF